MPKDYYDILGVPRNASQDDIRKAYRTLAHKYHPDKTGGDKAAEEKLKEINAAYNTLRNPEKRAQYDRFGEAGEQFSGARGGFGGFGDFGSSGNFTGTFEDIFDAFFGQSGGRRRPGATPGNDLEYRLTITLREAAFGTKKTIVLTRMELCGDCNGSGAAPGSGPETCPHCGGSGQVRLAQGFFSVTRTCPHCHGSGRVITNPCKRCGGGGRVAGKRELSVDVPPGVDTGARLRIAGEGEPGSNGGPRGDLYIYMEMEDDDFFVRDRNNIVCEVPISFAQAALGATIRVPTLKNEAELKIPPGTQAGTVFKLRGLGVPDLRGYRQGDQLVKVHVETPTKLTREQKDLLARFDELSNSGNTPLHRRFMDRLKQSLGG